MQWSIPKPKTEVTVIGTGDVERARIVELGRVAAGRRPGAAPFVERRLRSHRTARFIHRQAAHDVNGRVEPQTSSTAPGPEKGLRALCELVRVTSKGHTPLGIKLTVVS